MDGMCWKSNHEETTREREVKQSSNGNKFGEKGRKKKKRWWAEKAFFTLPTTRNFLSHLEELKLKRTSKYDTVMRIKVENWATYSRSMLYLISNTKRTEMCSTKLFWFLIQWQTYFFVSTLSNQSVFFPVWLTKVTRTQPCKNYDRLREHTRSFEGTLWKGLTWAQRLLGWGRDMPWDSNINGWKNPDRQKDKTSLGKYICIAHMQRPNNTNGR